MEIVTSFAVCDHPFVQVAREFDATQHYPSGIGRGYRSFRRHPDHEADEGQRPERSTEEER